MKGGAGKGGERRKKISIYKCMLPNSKTLLNSKKKSRKRHSRRAMRKQNMKKKEFSECPKKTKPKKKKQGNNSCSQKNGKSRATKKNERWDGKPVWLMKMKALLLGVRET